jgi:hypothetical protein
MREKRILKLFSVMVGLLMLRKGGKEILSKPNFVLESQLNEVCFGLNCGVVQRKVVKNPATLSRRIKVS